MSKPAKSVTNDSKTCKNVEIKSGGRAMTDNTQELDEITSDLWVKYGRPGTMDEFVPEAKQAILNWHNKQVKNAVVTAEDNLDQYWNKELNKQIEGVLDRLEGKTKALPTWESTSMVDGFDVLSAIEAERAKLKESTDE